ncbi:hypothetical protein MUP38_05855, partial [Candidatus Bathyarchaeota archaeon]|nr:hypothetical protein [Candidatus Bathyarchaeota archaeon]
LIESISDPKQNSWRLEAIRWINRGVRKYVNPVLYKVDASDINANIKIMESIYRKCHLTHKIALSPTGGKLQAVATFCLKIMHPDIHIVYPVVREFAQDYTEGYLTHYEVFFQSFRDYVNDLNQYRMRDLAAIREILNNKTRKPAIG